MGNRLLFIGDSRDIDHFEGKINAIEMAESMANIGVTWQHFTGISGFIHRGQEKLRAYFSIDDENIEVKHDILSEYIPEAHRRGIKIFLYLNVHWYPEGFLKRHPEWLQLKINGMPKTGLYDLPNSVTPCLNSPWREWIFEVATKIVRKYDIDGFFLDGPVFFEDTCYCRYCKEKFYEMFGEELDPGRLDDLRYKKKFIEFKYKSLGDFLKDFKEKVSSVKPSILIYMNGGHPQANWHNGRDNARHVDYQDLIGAEGGFIGRRLTDPDNNFRRTSITSKFLETASRGKPSIIFSDVAFKPWSAYPLTKTEVDLMVASIIANGSSPHFVYHYPILKEKYYEFLKSNYLFFKNIDGIGESVSMAKVAVLFSQSTADMFTGEQLPTDLTLFRSTGEMRKSFTYSLYGVSEILFRLHIPFDIIHERTILEGNIDNYDVIIMPNTMFIDEKTVDRLEKFSSDKKTIIANLETSLFNFEGEYLGDFALSDLLGVNYIGQEVLPYYDYLYLTDKSMIDLRYIPTMSRKVKVKTRGDILAYFIEKRIGVYSHLTNPSDPAIIKYKNNVYIAGNFYETYWIYRFPEYLTLIRKLLPSSSHILVGSNLPGSVEVEFRKAHDKIFMFLINYTGGMERPIREPIKIKDIICKMKLDYVSEIYSHSLEKELKYSMDNGIVEMKIPYLNVYDVIEISK